MLDIEHDMEPTQPYHSLSPPITTAPPGWVGAWGHPPGLTPSLFRPPPPKARTDGQSAKKALTERTAPYLHSKAYIKWPNTHGTSDLLSAPYLNSRCCIQHWPSYFDLRRKGDEGDCCARPPRQRVTTGVVLASSTWDGQKRHQQYGTELHQSVWHTLS